MMEIGPSGRMRQRPIRNCAVLLLDTAALPPKPWSIGLSAIIEEEDGTISYWALAHPPGRPDFHHPDCLALGDQQA